MFKYFLIIVFISIIIRLFYNYWYFIPPLIESIRHPIQPYHSITWNNINNHNNMNNDNYNELKSNIKENINKDNKPNLILIVVDDMGFNDISIHGGFRDIIKTPNIDKIGKQGVLFKNAYAGHATCAPCRAALLTGRHASNIGYEFTPADATASWILGSVMGNGKLHGVYHSDHASSLNVSHMVLPRSEVLLPEVLQSNGYHTVQIGKWHLGSRPGYHPIDRGFNESLGFDIISSYLPYGSSNAVGCHLTDFFDKYLWASSRYEVKKDNGPSFNPKGYLTDYLSEQASDAIKHFSSQNNPYFLYLGYTSMHTPLTALKSDYDHIINLEKERVKEYALNKAPYPPKPLTTCERVYGAMLLALDRGIGTVLDAIEQSPHNDNTMIIFTNDNGAPSIFPELNRPYRGSKATFFEGGIRVPMLLKYPKFFPNPMIYDKMVSHIDIFDTMIAAAGIKSSQSNRDGVNLLPYLFYEQSKSVINSIINSDNNNIETETNTETVSSPSSSTTTTTTTTTTSKFETPHNLLFWRSGHYMALRYKNYKLQVSFNYHTNLTSYWLFDIHNDPYERKNILTNELTQQKNDNYRGGSKIESNIDYKSLTSNLQLNENTRELFQKMLEIIQEQNSIHPIPLWPSLSETPVLLDKIFYDPYVEGDEYIYWPN